MLLTGCLTLAAPAIKCAPLARLQINEIIIEKAAIRLQDFQAMPSVSLFVIISLGLEGNIFSKFVAKKAHVSYLYVLFP